MHSVPMTFEFIKKDQGTQTQEAETICKKIKATYQQLVQSSFRRNVFTEHKPVQVEKAIRVVSFRNSCELVD